MLTKPKKIRQTISGIKFPPSSLVQLLDPNAWEDFIEDCCRIEMGEGKKYAFVQKIGGAGDAGRDIEARYVSELAEYQWDLYQGKHYLSAIGESILYPELAKVFHHIKIKTYPSPNKYYVCAPKNTTPTLHDLIAKPEQLRKKFLKSWREGKHGIAVSKFPLDMEVEAIVEKFDFSKIRECPIKDLIALHEKDAIKHGMLFGLETSREDVDSAPLVPADIEQTYLAETLNVYREHSKLSLTLSDAFQSEQYGSHLESCRSEFYSADGLKRFSQEIFPGEFEKLLVDVHNGVKRLVGSPKYGNGLERMDAVLDHAGKMHVSENPLSKRLLPADLPGTCHHLVSDKKIKWVK